MKSSYLPEDVTILLKNITGLVQPLPTLEREKLIQAGRHYCEMLPIEYAPSEKYMQAYQQALTENAKATAEATGVLADRILQARGNKIVLVSLARAGIPAGILLKWYFSRQRHLELPHYSISIIRGKGIDHNAMAHILSRHHESDLLFVDGWTGKGAILGELKKSVAAFPGVSPDLAVLADPANITPLCGTHKDLLIPSSCLNCTISGLISRTFLREDLIGPSDFHGAVYYEMLQEQDLSYSFLHTVASHFQPFCTADHWVPKTSGIQEVTQIAQEFGMEDVNLIKPGIGETTRVLLRRVPWKILVPPNFEQDPCLSHILRLASERGAAVQPYPLKNYKACGLIRQLADT